MLITWASQQQGGAPFAGWGSHTVWRFWADAMNVDTYVGWREIRAYDILGNQIPLVGAGFTYAEGGAGAQGGHGAAAPFDNNPGTYWLRSGAPSWVEVTCPAGVIPVRFEFECQTVARAVINFHVQYGDGGALTTAFTGWEPSYVVDGDFRSWPQSFPAGKWKQLRLMVPTSNGNSFAAINRLEFRETVGGANYALASLGCAGSSNQAGTNPENAFDGSDASICFINTAGSPIPAYCAGSFPTPKSIAQYQIMSNNDVTRVPRDFTLYGTNDGITVTALNAQVGQAGAIPFTGTYNV